MSLHVIPLNDERKHERSPQCWCEPDAQWVDGETGAPYPGGALYTHHAVDCREVVEAATGESLAPERQWGVFET